MLLQWYDLLVRDYVKKFDSYFEKLERRDPSTTWDSDVVREKMTALQANMSVIEKAAFFFTYGIFGVPYDENATTEREEPIVPEAPFSTTRFGFTTITSSLKKVGLRFGLSFKEHEQSELEFAPHFANLFNVDGFNLMDHWKDVELSLENLPDIRTEADLLDALEKRVHRPLSNVILSLLNTPNKSHIALVAFARMEEKGVIKDIVEDPRQLCSLKAVYTCKGETSLSGMGINASPHFVVGYEASFWEDGVPHSYGLTFAFVLGTAVMPGIHMKKTFDVMNTFLLSGDREFYEMVARGGDNDSDHDTTGSQRGRSEEMEKAVILFSKISDLTTQACHAGVMKVYLTDFNDYLLITINPACKKVEPKCEVPNFPYLIECDYKWFNRSEEYFISFLCSFIATV